MSNAASQPHLRLVGVDDAEVLERWRRRRQARQEAARETRAAAGNPGLEPTDPRWVLAVRAYSQLQGTTMTPERRQRMIRTARTLGVRPFDANLVIAIVQDHARRGLTLQEAEGTLKLLEKPRAAARPAWTPWMRWAAAILAAGAANLLLIRWLLQS